jgi:hypothetical protein
MGVVLAALDENTSLDEPVGNRKAWDVSLEKHAGKREAYDVKLEQYFFRVFGPESGWPTARLYLFRLGTEASRNHSDVLLKLRDNTVRLQSMMIYSYNNVKYWHSSMIQTKLSATRTLSYEVWLAESSILEGKVDDTPPAPCGCCSLALLRLMLEGKVKEDHAFLP